MKNEPQTFWQFIKLNSFVIILIAAVVWDIVDRRIIDSKYTWDPREQSGYDTVSYKDSTYATYMRVDSVWYDPPEYEPEDRPGP